MKIRYLPVLFILVACGSSDTEELNKNTVTLNPPGGTYSFRPWITMRKADTGIGSGVLKVKAPGATEFQDASICPEQIVGDADIFNTDCTEIRETGEILHYLENSGGKSDERSEVYTIELAQKDLTAGLLSSPTATESKDDFTLAESNTSCILASDKITIVVHFSSDKLPEGYTGYLLFRVNEPETGKSITVNQDNNDLSVVIVIQPTSDTAPSSPTLSSANYTTSQGYDYVNSSQPASSCSISLAAFERNGVTTGSISCNNLANYDLDIENTSSKIPLGKNVKLSADWQCDEYIGGY